MQPDLNSKLVACEVILPLPGTLLWVNTITLVPLQDKVVVFWDKYYCRGGTKATHGLNGDRKFHCEVRESERWAIAWGRDWGVENKMGRGGYHEFNKGLKLQNAYLDLKNVKYGNMLSILDDCWQFICVDLRCSQGYFISVEAAMSVLSWPEKESNTSIITITIILYQIHYCC